uniref:Pentatricopeptide repeat-containing protein n=1 Tax=Tanacetum cinerariifolium TaxID=118510 RepID=A0A6L2J5T7_TANCI|nr:pentatricopeptide repeat-containing protein [Tanacetum cinerariifolium]
MFIKFMIQNQFFSYSLEEFAQILDIPYDGACVFTNKWSLDELVYGVPTDGPYQTNPPSPNDIILSTRIGREAFRRDYLGKCFLSGGDSYVLYDIVMNPLTSQQEQKTRKDRGMRRVHHSTSSSSAFNLLSSSHLNDDGDGNDEGTLRQFWFTVKKNKKTTSYEFYLADKKCKVDVELFKKILGICLRVPNEDFIVPSFEESLINFLYELGYKGQINKLESMIVDHMHQPWRALATIINKRLYGKTSNNDRLRQSRVGIIWGAYKVFIAYSTGSIPLKKTRGKDSQGKKETVTPKKKTFIYVDDNIIPGPNVALDLGKSISKTEAEIAEEERHTSNVSKKKSLDWSYKLKGIQVMTKEEQLAAARKKAIKASKEALRLQKQTEDSSEGAGITTEVPDEIIGKSTTSSKGAGIVLELSTDDEEKGNEDDDDEDDDRSIDIKETNDERTDSNNAIEAPDALGTLSEAFTVVLQRVSTLEKDVKELKQVDHTRIVVESIRSQGPPTTKHDDQDEDPTDGSDQGKDKKRPRKDTQPLKKSSTSKESCKGNNSPKTFKSGKSVTAEEPDEEHVHEMSMDVEENIVHDMGNANEQPNGEAPPNTNNIF